MRSLGKEFVLREYTPLIDFQAGSYNLLGCTVMASYRQESPGIRHGSFRPGYLGLVLTYETRVYVFGGLAGGSGGQTRVRLPTLGGLGLALR